MTSALDEPLLISYQAQVLKYADRPDAILFVPIAGEFDETLVVHAILLISFSSWKPHH